jgi:hypothetical protein
VTRRRQECYSYLAAAVTDRLLIIRVLRILGLAGMFLGVLDPFEGSGAIMAGTGLVTLGAFLGKSRYCRLMYWSLVLVVIGVAALWISTALGGFGGDTGIAVGTALASGPPRRSQRALLTHWAPASGSGVEAHVWEGMLHAGGW